MLFALELFGLILAAVMLLAAAPLGTAVMIVGVGILPFAIAWLWDSDRAVACVLLLVHVAAFFVAGYLFLHAGYAGIFFGIPFLLILVILAWGHAEEL